MSIRIPAHTDMSIQNAFRDIEQSLNELRAAIDLLGRKIPASTTTQLGTSSSNRLPDDKRVFIKSGPQHAVGLVPDPGATPGTTKYLCENGTWAVPA